MIDGVSAEYFRRKRINLPNLNALANGGLLVHRVAADVPGTSLPGRTSMLTGVPASRHGVFGNTIWDGQMFRYANPDDVRTPVLPRAAMDLGLTSAVVGFGMVRPEDATIFKGPWWANEMLQRARDEAPIPADESWLRTARASDETGTWERLKQAGYEAQVADAYAGDATHYLLASAAGDRTMLRWSAALAASPDPPDLLMTEILLTDTVQHLYGQEHPFTDWALGFADDLVGTLVAQLVSAGRLADTALLVTSDHGHGEVTDALYTDALLPGRPVASEGSVLLAHVEGASDAHALSRLLEPHGVQRLPQEYLPEDRRNDVALFCAPDGWAFQARPAETVSGEGPVTGRPRYRSSHGFRPGHPADERFAILSGPGIGPAERQWAAAEDVAATIAEVIGIGEFGAGNSFL